MKITHAAVREENGSKHLFRVGVDAEISLTEYAAKCAAMYWGRRHRRAAAVLIAIDGGKKA